MSEKPKSVDLTDAHWIRPSESPATKDNCVEVAFIGDQIVMRDGAHPEKPSLIFTAAEWDAFVEGAKDGEFDL